MVDVYEHPLSDLVIAGEAVNPLPTVFHTLLQSVADLMLLPPPGMYIFIKFNVSTLNKNFFINFYDSFQKRKIEINTKIFKIFKISCNECLEHL